MKTPEEMTYEELVNEWKGLNNAIEKSDCYNTKDIIRRDLVEFQIIRQQQLHGIPNNLCLWCGNECSLEDLTDLANGEDKFNPMTVCPVCAQTVTRKVFEEAY